jgi:hypothetical protein
MYQTFRAVVFFLLDVIVPAVAVLLPLVAIWLSACKWRQQRQKETARMTAFVATLRAVRRRIIRVPNVY